MPAFRFALAPALDLALLHERDGAAAFVLARNALTGANEAVELVRARVAQARSLYQTMSASGRPHDSLTSVLIAGDWYLDRLREIGSRRFRELDKANAAVADARERFELARRRRRAFEHVRERLLAEHRARAALREAAEYDESNASGGSPALARNDEARGLVLLKER